MFVKPRPVVIVIASLTLVPTRKSYRKYWFTGEVVV